MRNDLGLKLLKINLIVVWSACGLMIINNIFIKSDFIRGLVYGIDLLILIQSIFTLVYDKIEEKKAWKQIEKELEERLKENGGGKHE